MEKCRQITLGGTNFQFAKTASPNYLNTGEEVSAVSPLKLLLGKERMQLTNNFFPPDRHFATVCLEREDTGSGFPTSIDPESYRQLKFHLH